MFFRKDITNEEIEIMARVLTEVIRNEVLEDLHADEGGNYIPQKIMGETKDKIRNSLYNHLTAMNNVEDSKAHMNIWALIFDNWAENGQVAYPIESDEKTIAFYSAIYAGDAKRLSELVERDE